MNIKTILHVRPLTIKKARRVVAALHRHLPRVQGGCFAAAVFEGGRLVGVGIAGLPVARMDMDGTTIEITRVAVEEGTHNACSKLYGALNAAAKALGFERSITKTLEEEPGTSLLAAGFVDCGLTDGGEWDRPSRRRDPAVQRGRKRRWEKRLVPMKATSGGDASRTLRTK